MKSALIMLAAILLGLVSGAMVLIASSLGPYWAGLAPEEFRRVFAAMWLGTTMLPLGAAALVVTLLALSSIAREPGLRRRWMLLAAALWLIPVVVYPFLFEPLNLQIAGNLPLSSEQVSDLLYRWRLLHWVRTALGIAAFAAATKAIAADSPTPGDQRQ